MKFSIAELPRYLLRFEIIGVVVAVLLVASLVFGWTSPSQVPPGGSGGITVGATAQNAGNVGIGTIFSGGAVEPTEKLQIYENVNGDRYISIGADATGAAGVTISNQQASGGIGGGVVFDYNASPQTLKISSSEVIAIGAGGVEGIRVAKDGDVGIGITAPTARLHVNGGIAIDGTPQQGRWNSRFSAPNSSVSIIQPGVSGQYTSITIGSDGLPIISYRVAGTSVGLWVLHCGDTQCLQGNTDTRVHEGPVVGNSSIAIGSDGYPIISYYDSDSLQQDLRVVKCTTVDCSTSNDYSVDTTGNVGQYSSIAISPLDGFPVISYYDTTNNRLKVVKCKDAICDPGAANFSITPIVSPGGQYSSIAIGIDGFPVIAHYDGSGLAFVKCGNDSCNSNNMILTLDPGNVGTYTSISIGNDGFPIISYYDATNGDLKVAKCGDTTCDPAHLNFKKSIVDSTNAVGQYTAIAVPPDGLPIISHFDATSGTGGDLRFVKCGAPSCDPSAAANSVYKLDSTGIVGQYTSLAIGADGLPIISYYDSTNTNLKVMHCGSDRCIPYWTRR